jgi:hypothetical protein
MSGRGGRSVPARGGRRSGRSVPARGERRSGRAAEVLRVAAGDGVGAVGAEHPDEL